MENMANEIIKNEEVVETTIKEAATGLTRHDVAVAAVVGGAIGVLVSEFVLVPAAKAALKLCKPKKLSAKDRDNSIDANRIVVDGDVLEEDEDE